jgi:hypothetical protein
MYQSHTVLNLLLLRFQFPLLPLKENKSSSEMRRKKRKYKLTQF